MTSAGVFAIRSASSVSVELSDGAEVLGGVDAEVAALREALAQEKACLLLPLLRKPAFGDPLASFLPKSNTRFS